MIDREEEMILESGDYYVVHYVEGPPPPLQLMGAPPPPKTKNFVFEKDKNTFVSELLANPCITSIEVGTFNKIK